MSGRYLTHQETSDLFQDIRFDKVWTRWQNAKSAWNCCWKTQDMQVEAYLHTYQSFRLLTPEAIPIALEFINARRAYLKLLRSNPQEQNPWLLKYSKGTP